MKTNEEIIHESSTEFVKTPALSNYDEIMEHQKMSAEEIKEHMTGPVIAILIHAILLPFIIGMVLSDPPTETEEVVIETVEIDSTPPPPLDPIDIPEPQDIETPDEQTFERVNDISEEMTENQSMDESDNIEIVEPIDIPNFIKPNNSHVVISSYRPFGESDGIETGNGPPGSRNRNGTRSALRGEFFDLKQNNTGKQIAMSNGEFCNVLKDFVRSDWNKTKLNTYFKSPVALYSPCFYIPMCNAEEAPKAFQCEKECKPSRWLAIYSGRVRAPKTGSFSFVGAGDDVLVVRVNQKVVLDYGWYSASLGKQIASNDWRNALQKSPTSDPAKRAEIEASPTYENPIALYPYSSTPHWNRHLGGVAVGDSFFVTAGEEIDIEILISEIPGGLFGASLLIQNNDEIASYERDPQTNSPILPLFRTSAHALPDPLFRTKEALPFAAGGEVWRVVNPKKSPVIHEDKIFIDLAKL